MTTMHQNDSRSSNPLRLVVWGLAAMALATPWVAMQFTNEVNWDRPDFVVFGIMLLVACGAYEFATRLTGNKAYRLGAGIALLGMFLLTWINLAVGIIGNEGNPANLIFLALPLVAGAGALMVRFRAHGMARVMVATSITQVLIAVIALVAGWGYIFVLTAFFVFLWLSSAHLFRKTAQTSPTT